MYLPVQTGHTVAGVYVGLPPDVWQTVEGRPSIWEKHFWMFIVVAILLLIALVTGLLCLICFYCCRATDKERKQQPVTALYCSTVHVCL